MILFQILVGSSMGGAIMLLLTLENPTRVQALLGIATAVMFDKPLSYSEETRSNQVSLHEGCVCCPYRDHSYSWHIHIKDGIIP